MNLKHAVIATILVGCPTLAMAGPGGARMINHLDSDGDSLVSFDEFKAPERKGPMEEADLNSDGMVTLNEMRQHMAERQAERAAEQSERRAEMAASMEERFNEMDLNGDGGVTPEEARQAMFNHMDENGDGYLSADEIRPPRGMRGEGYPRRFGGDGE